VTNDSISPKRRTVEEYKGIEEDKAVAIREGLPRGLSAKHVYKTGRARHDECGSFRKRSRYSYVLYHCFCLRATFACEAQKFLLIRILSRPNRHTVQNRVFSRAQIHRHFEKLLLLDRILDACILQVFRHVGGCVLFLCELGRRGRCAIDGLVLRSQLLRRVVGSAVV